MVSNVRFNPFGRPTRGRHFLFQSVCEHSLTISCANSKELSQIFTPLCVYFELHPKFDKHIILII
jgi:hypothetical protein